MKHAGTIEATQRIDAEIRPYQRSGLSGWSQSIVRATSVYVSLIGNATVMSRSTIAT